MKTYVVDWCENCQTKYSVDYEAYKTKVLTGDNICYHQFIKKKIIKPNIINACKNEKG